MVHPTDVKNVLPKNNSAKPLFSTQLNLWCTFDDGSMTPTYSYYYKDPDQDASLLDCPLSSFASDQLWRYNRTLRVYLFSLTNKYRRVPILKAFVTVPTSIVPQNSKRQSLTLCTSPLQNKAKYLAQWIEFHRLVGFQKFVIYNTTDKYQQLLSTVNAINKKHPHMVDVIQWNFASLNITDTCPTRYFQIQALNDCFIRYGDQSEWMGMLDLDEYVVPLHPYKTVADYLYHRIGSHVIGSINLWSQFFCSRDVDKYTPEEEDESRLVIERFTYRAKTRYKLGREKYLYRPRFVQYLTIHYQLVGLSKEESSEKDIMLAHYVTMDRLRSMQGCGVKECVNDTSVRDRFAEIVKTGIAN
jgi:hypothetical protein